MMNPDLPEFKAAVSVVARLRDAGFGAYIVGGAVRNMLLDLQPKDFDVATSARPEDIARLFSRTLMIGESFGVAVVVQDDVRIEVATFRKDGRYIDFRHPESVQFSSAEEDAKRRDFTINALFYDPVEDRVIDYVDGQRDLENRILRTVGNADDRFQEDALRMMRAVRFARRFDLAIDPDAVQAIQRHAAKLSRISAERVREELLMILTGPQPGDAIQQMFDLGLLHVILPEVARMHGVAQPVEYHPEGDVLRHTILCLNNMQQHPSRTLATAVLLHDVGKPPTYAEKDRIRFNEHAPVGADMASRICRRLRFSNDERKQIVGLIKDHMRFLDVQKMKRAKLRRYIGKEKFEEDLELHRVDCVSSHGTLDNYYFCLQTMKDLANEGQTAAPPPLITGDDLIAMGIKPGPDFKIILQKAYDSQLEGKVRTREEALEELRSIVADQL